MVVPWVAVVVTDPPRMVALRKEEVDGVVMAEGVEVVVATELHMRLTMIDNRIKTNSIVE